MMDYLITSKQAIDKSVSFIRGIKGQTSNPDTIPYVIFSAIQIIEDTLNLLQFKFKKSKIQLITDIDNTILLFGSPRSLSKIITNLINNALDASRGMDKPITLKLIRDGNDHALLTVEDRGSGISEENMTRIFDPFFTTKTFGESTGLGLGIVKEQVKQFKGTIKVESKDGLTKFMISLPLAN